MKMTVETTRFGALEVSDSALITMPSGPLGFEGHKRFCLIDHSPEANFRWLQSAEEPSLAFVVVDPSEYFADYEIEISDSDVEKLQLTSEDDAIVLATLTIRNNGQDVSANLAAPIIINSKNLTAAQVVLQDERYTTRHPVIQTCSTERAIAKAA